MNTTKNALPEVISTNRKIGNLLALPKITVQDIEDLSQPNPPPGRKDQHRAAKFKRYRTDSFLEKIDPILPASTKNKRWEHQPCGN